MNRASVFAEFFRADECNNMHIYDNGIILIVACSLKRHEVVKADLQNMFPQVEEARSGDGFASVFVIPLDMADCDPNDFDSSLQMLTNG